MPPIPPLRELLLIGSAVIGLLILVVKVVRKARRSRLREERLASALERQTAVRAVGGTLELLNQLIVLIEQQSPEPKERQYMLGRVLPLAEDAYHLGQFAREKSLKLGKLALIVPFGSAMVSLLSSGFVPPQYQGISLLFLGFFSGGDTLLRGYVAMSQPSLEWIAARRTFGTLTRETVLRLTETESYAGITDPERFLLYTERCEAAIDMTEDDVLDQIKFSLSVTTSSSKGKDDGVGGAVESASAASPGKSDSLPPPP